MKKRTIVALATSILLTVNTPAALAAQVPTDDSTSTSTESTLANGKAVTEENVLEILLQLEQEWPTWTIWGTRHTPNTHKNKVPYAPTGNFELKVAGSTAWNSGKGLLAIYKTENGSTQAATIPVSTAFALLEDKGGGRVKIGYLSGGGWTGADLNGTGWVDKDSVLVNLPDVLPSIAYQSDGGKQFSSRLTRFEYAVPGTYALAEQLALLQAEAMSSVETLVVRQSSQTVSVGLAKGIPE